MSKLAEREAKRRSAVAGLIAQKPEVAAQTGAKELKKRISLSVRPSLYGDVQKIAYVQRRSVSEVVEELLEGYREKYAGALEEYGKLKR